MPEGDTLHRTARTLQQALAGDLVKDFHTEVESVRRMAAARPLAGRQVEQVEARGKHLLVHFSASGEGPLILHTHLRMTGSWHLYRHGEPWRKPQRRAVAVLTTAAWVAPCFSAPVVELLTPWQLDRHPQISRLGPDAIRADFDLEASLALLLEDPAEQIGTALMRQRSLAGVGNVFKSEILFLEKIDPFRRAGSLGPEKLRSILAQAARLLALNRAGSARRTRFGLQQAERLWVYGRSGRPCRLCGSPIRMRRQGMARRSTYYCPVCQHVAEPESSMRSGAMPEKGDNDGG